MRGGCFVKNSIAFVGVMISICCRLVIMVSFFRLPEVSLGNKVTGPHRTIRNRKVYKDEAIGKFGEMMIEMLPEDLAFTVFVPSDKAFERDVRLQMDDSLVAEKRNDTYAVASRILGFSAVPRTLSSTTVPSGKEVYYDSLSGFTLYISKDVDGMLVVNRIRSEKVDLRRREIVIHVMDGEFEQAVQPDYTDKID